MNNKYCNNCKYLTERSGYCLKCDMLLAKEKISKEWLKAWKCVLEGYREE